MSDHLAAIEEYRGLRDALEAAVLPLATSVDGRRFEYQASLHGLELEAGGYVAVDAGAESHLGQVLSLAMESRELAVPGGRGQVLVRAARGTGALLDTGVRPFHDAQVRPATPDEVGAWAERTRAPGARLPVGELALAPGVPFELDASGFGRHTFLCGQSGSGKTYSLGVLLEQLLSETSLRLLVLDPNSDYVRLGEPRPDADAAAAERYAERAGPIVVRSWRGRRRAPRPALPRPRRGAPGGAPAARPGGRPRRVRGAGGRRRDRHAGELRGPRARRGGGPAAGAPRHQPGRRPVRHLVARRRRLAARRPRKRRHPLPGGRSRLARHERRALARGRQPAGAPLEPAGGARADRDRDRRGPQRLPGRTERSAHGARHRGCDPDRRRGPQVRPLPDRGHPAPAEGARERALAVRQPRR